ncbi:MAG: hypothetical protein K2X41_03435 [Hyphomicrobium sp.]|nr:hypothetical protein [Hyphomicrobium sp.]
MPSRTLNRVLWVGVLVLIAVLAVKSRDTFDNVFMGVGKLDVRDAPDSDTVVLTWRGQIEAPMARRIGDAVERYASERRTFVLSLSSPGGSLAHGAEVVRLLQKIGEAHSLETRVEAGRLCASMCVPVYLQGQRRTASPDAKFMFHEVSFRDFFAKDGSEISDAAKGSATDRLFAKYFTPAGVPDAWIRKVRADMAGGNDVWKTARELIAENANIVQAARELKNP